MPLPYSPLPQFVKGLILVMLAIFIVRLSLATVIAATLLGIRMILPNASPLREPLLELAKRSSEIASLLTGWFLKISFYGFILFVLVLALMGFGA